MNINESPEVQSPTQREVILITLACAWCLAYLMGIASPAVEMLRVWWAEMLIYALVPLALTFTLLCSSHIHRELSSSRRLVVLFGDAVLIFGGVLFFLLAVAFFGGIFAGLARGHF